MTDKQRFTMLILGFALMIPIAYGIWVLKREWNAYFYYDDNTKEMICKMVKPEALKDPKVCNE